jgi:uncharacterized protein (DUF58 family)
MARHDHDRLAGRAYVLFEVLDRIASLEMRARELVEGTMAGLQRSPYLGASSEFAQHRAYVPGDDVRHMDWKVYGRTQRYYVRQYQEETNFVVTFLLDCSESMRYGSLSASKLDHACLLTASLAWLALRQSDAVSLAMFDESILGYLPPRTSLGSLGVLASQLETVQARRGTNLANVVPVLGRMLRRRGVVVILSDLLDMLDPDQNAAESPFVRAIQQLRFERHELIVFHVMDPLELTFDFHGRTRFEALELPATAVAEPSRIRADYLNIVHAFLAQVKESCAAIRADYALANTAEPVDHLLVRYLSARGKAREGRR